MAHRPSPIHCLVLYRKFAKSWQTHLPLSTAFFLFWLSFWTWSTSLFSLQVLFIYLFIFCIHSFLCLEDWPHIVWLVPFISQVSAQLPPLTVQSNIGLLIPSYSPSHSRVVCWWFFLVPITPWNFLTDMFTLALSGSLNRLYTPKGALPTAFTVVTSESRTLHSP